MKLSFVIPCYHSAATVGAVVDEIERTCADLSYAATDYEIILVNDGSGDDTWTVLRRLAETHAEVQSLDLARNFGQHAALMAGLAETKGEI
ncbi:MAG: glycosyltransferase, partial [Lachnospiraceae bacterium]|nr:glycosyltransferase [Lachnospiraceae bacterium]